VAARNDGGVSTGGHSRDSAPTAPLRTASVSSTRCSTRSDDSTSQNAVIPPSAPCPTSEATPSTHAQTLSSSALSQALAQAQHRSWWTMASAQGASKGVIRIGVIPGNELVHKSYALLLDPPPDLASFHRAAKALLPPRSGTKVGLRSYGSSLRFRRRGWTDSGAGGAILGSRRVMLGVSESADTWRRLREASLFFKCRDGTGRDGTGRDGT
jgi:hypothetical protein